MSVIKPILQHPESIVYFLGANNYCWLYFRNGEKKLLAKPISYLESKLPDFIRVHKTALINPAYVKTLNRPAHQKMSGTIQLENGDIVPVSRRRWQFVFELIERYRSTGNSAEVTSGAPAVSIPRQVVNQPEGPLQTIILITDDGQNGQLVKQTIESKWPHYQLHYARQSTHLPDLFGQLPQHEYPILLLLDARTTSLERLHTLQRLKKDPRLCRIPAILLVSPTNQSVTDGYQRQANSVISIPEGERSFTQAIERICQFWLRTAALPGTGREA